MAELGGTLGRRAIERSQLAAGSARGQRRDARSLRLRQCGTRARRAVGGSGLGIEQRQTAVQDRMDAPHPERAPKRGLGAELDLEGGTGPRDLSPDGAKGQGRTTSTAFSS